MATTCTAGCAGVLGLDSAPDRTWDDRPDGEFGEPPADAKRRVSLTDVGTTPEEADVALDVAVTDPWIAPDGTATLEAWMRNVGDEPDTFSLPYYKGHSAQHGEPGLLLYSTEAPDGPPEGYAPECLYGSADGDDAWDPPGTHDGEHVLFTAELRLPPELAPGESHTETLRIAEDPTVEECLPPGEYRFGRVVRLEEVAEGEDGETVGFDEVEEREDLFLWTFTVAVETLE